MIVPNDNLIDSVIQRRCVYYTEIVSHSHRRHRRRPLGLFTRRRYNENNNIGSSRQYLFGSRQAYYNK